MSQESGFSDLITDVVEPVKSSLWGTSFGCDPLEVPVASPFVPLGERNILPGIQLSSSQKRNFLGEPLPIFAPGRK